MPKKPQTANLWCSEIIYSMFGAILKHFINVLSTTLSVFWNATNISFQIVPFKFTLLAGGRQNFLLNEFINPGFLALKRALD